MSCFKIFFIFTNILLVICITKALAKQPNEVIVAKVNNHFITAQDVLNATNRLPKKIREKPLSEIYPKIVNELINQHLIAKKAYKDNLDKNKVIIEILNKNRDQILAKYWLNNFLANTVTEKKLRNFYNQYIENFQTFKEYNASHILVKQEDKALQIIKELNSKADFSNLAKNYSIGPSKQNGGNLGWFKSGQMVREFEKAILNLKKGMTTKKPIKTKFGYHIIMLNDVRNSKPKKYSDIKQKIIDKIKQRSLSKLEKEIRNNEKITILDFKTVVKEINNQ
tara:strand:+ start:62 stop:904 length:843 start_codon:yes stop_codon:yes gene_type:complete